MSSTHEWRAHWPLVLTGFIGISLGPAPFYALGLMMGPLSEELGWNRTQISSGASFAGLLTIVLAPILGMLVDRYGVRRITLPGIVLAACSIASLSLANESQLLWLVLWAGYAVAALALKSTIWSTAISGQFYSGRSLALAIVMSGTSLAMFVVPPLMRWLVDDYGWRNAWVYMGVGWAVPVFILCTLFLFDARDRIRTRIKAEARNETHPSKQKSKPPILTGLTVQEALKNIALYRIGLATLVIMLMSAGLVIHQVPLLEEAGIDHVAAAYLASLTGIAGLLGNIVTGWLMNRFNAGNIAAIAYGTTALGLVFLLEPFRTATTVVIAIMFVGYTGGCKLVVCAYLTSQYAGLQNYGKIFGVMGGLIAASFAIGPILGGLAYDLSGSYEPLIVFGIAATALSALLLMKLGPYPVWSDCNHHTI